LNKILYLLAALHKKYKIDRLVIDSITELERAKSGAQPEVKVFLAGLIQFLRDRKITTMFICRSDTFFRSIDKIEEQVLSLVDLIICIRNFDMRNQIHKGVYIQKARGRNHNSKIMRMTIDSREGIDIEDSGWDVEYLLAGDTSNIQPPRVFFKLFYENPAEEFINDAIIKDFDIDRYPGDEPIFRGVRKSSIHTEFWSFRGQYSAGHANTRVLSIADHVISAFRDNNRLTQLKHYVKGELIKNIEDDPYLLRLFDLDTQSEKKEQDAIKAGEDTSEKRLGLKYKIDAIPSYRDFGVMVYRGSVSQENSKPEVNDRPNSTEQPGKKSRRKSEGKNRNLPEYLKYLEQLSGTAKAMHNQYNEDAGWLGKEEKGEFLKAYTWQNLVEWIKTYNGGGNGDNDIPKYAFAFPPLDNKSEFIAFFMELLWSFGGDIYDIPIYEEYSIANYRRRSKEIIRSRILFDLHECADILENKSEKQGNDSDRKGEKGFTFFLESLKNRENIYELLEEKFKRYGIAKERIVFSDFIDWIVEISNDTERYVGQTLEPVMNWNSPSFKTTINLILRLIYEAKVINPIHGDYRKDSVLSRHWYSHLSIDKMKKKMREEKERWKGCPAADTPPREMEDEGEDNFEKKLLPLPLAEIAINEKHSYYRSVSCHTYWCLVMLEDALSPEIGGNFIESLLASEYYKWRLSMEAGMPVVNPELSKQEYIDINPDAYALVKRIVDNGVIHEDLNSALSKSLKGNGEDIKNILYKNDHAYVRFDLLKKIGDKAEKEKAKKELEEIAFDDNVKKSLSKRMFYPKYRQTRVGFYHIEQALHQRIREILMLEVKKRKPQSLGEMQTLLAEHLEVKMELEEASDTLDNFVLEEVINEFRLHAILELLVSFYLEEEEK